MHMTSQEVFDKVITHLVAQKVRSFNIIDSEICAYRGENGTSCAVGCLIPDELYKPEMEIAESGYPGAGVRELLRLHLELNFLYEHLSLLNQLQDLHDAYIGRGLHNQHNARVFWQRTEEIAIEFNLKSDHLIPAKYKDQ